MPRHWKALIVLATLIAATLSFGSFASAHTDNVTVIHLTTVDVESHLVDVAPTGGPPSLGDTLVFSENLFRNGHRVGFTTGVCTIARVQHPPTAFQCQATAYLGGDQLMQRMAQGGGTASWQRVWSGATVSQLAGYVRRNRARLHPSETDTPLTADADRRLARVGALASVTRQAGRHVLKAGTEIQQLRLTERFGFAVTGETRPLREGSDEMVERMVLATSTVEAPCT